MAQATFVKSARKDILGYDGEVKIAKGESYYWWKFRFGVSWQGKRVFCNPPYGPGMAQWLERGLEAEVAVYLIPARTDTRWFHDICLPQAKEIRFIKGRLKFGDAVNSAPFPSMIVIFEK